MRRKRLRSPATPSCSPFPWKGTSAEHPSAPQVLQERGYNHNRPQGVFLGRSSGIRVFCSLMLQGTHLARQWQRCSQPFWLRVP